MPGKKGRGKSGARQRENRKFGRLPIELPILYGFVENKRTRGGETGNISEGGLLVYLKEALREGMKLKIEIFPPDLFGLEPIKAVTQIVWAPAHQGEGWSEYFQHGLEFIEMNDRDSLKLKQLLSYIEE